MDTPVESTLEAAPRRGLTPAALMILAGFGALLLAGGLLWWRDGERLFTDGLISAIARCF